MSADHAELRVTRTFRAPLERVWRMWAERDLRAQWWGPEGFTCVSLEQDFRPGGPWRVHIWSAKHGDLYASGVFREIERHERLCFTFRWDGDASETVATVSFEERDGHTLQHFHQTPFESVQTRDGHVVGWNSSFDRLAGLAEVIGDPGPGPG